MKQEDELFHKLHIELLLSNDISATLDKFFQSNVVIPKGENRHPYADVLHEWIEGAEMQWRDSEFDEWCLNPRFKDCEYRIKPSEPVYEYQWYYFVNGKVNVYHAFMTIDEYNDGNKALKFSLNRFEETKRERQ